MKKCEDVRESLGAWLDGELRQSEAEAVRLHVETCVACGEGRRRLELLDNWLKRDLEASAGQIALGPFWREVRQRITERKAWHERLWDWVDSAFVGPRLAWAVPAFIVMLIAALSIESFFPGWRSGSQGNNFATVDSIDAYGRNVALLREDETKTTVIWLYQNQEGENEPAAESTETRPSF